MRKVLITGATGFIGGSLVQWLSSSGDYEVIASVRSDSQKNELCKTVISGDISPYTDWSLFLDGCDVVIHTACSAHFRNIDGADQIEGLRTINVDATLNLAKQAIVAGVKRFIFISSAAIHGDFSYRPFVEIDAAKPSAPLAASKLEAELALFDLANNSDLEVVVIRPPLVYGHGAPGNFGKLMKIFRYGLPLPFGAVDNRRDLVGIDNLVDFIIVCIEHPAAANQTFLVSDGEDLSTTGLFTRLARAMERPPRLIPVPVTVLAFGAKLLGKQAEAQRLLGSFQVDISKARDLLDWEPPVSVDDGLKRCVAGMSQDKFECDNMLIRLFDIFFSFVGLLLGSPVLLFLIMVGLFDTGSPIFRQERVGKGRKPFILVKFRTMKLDTPSEASHLASSSSITKLGSFLRKTKLDELPQLWNVLKGEMSLVGPRPCLYNQEELIEKRTERGVYAVRPGITGLAQVNEIDMSTPELLAETDMEMITTMSVKDYFRYIFMTIAGKGSGDRIKK